VDALVQDLRYAARTLARARGFTVAATTALALGIGATTALFSVVWAVLLQPLPYRAPDRLVTVLHGDEVNGPVSPADYIDFRRSSRSFSGMAAAQAWGANLSADGRAERVPAMQVGATMFDVLGVRAARGRTFTAAEKSPAGARVTVIAYGLWTRRFGADPAIVGRRVRLNGELYTIVGVMPPGFRFAPFWQTAAELWVPLVLEDRRADRGGRSLRVFARLADGVTLEQARAEMRVLNDRLVQAYPDSSRGLTTGVVTLPEKAGSRVRLMILATFGMAVIVLLIACANVATLCLARALGRSRELAVRAALGAGRARLIRLLLAEGLILGIVGAAVGLLLAGAATTALARFLPPDALPPHAVLRLSIPVVAFAVATAVISGFITTILPVWHVRLRAPAEALRAEGRTSTGTRSSRVTRRLMVTIEVALAMTLLASAGLLGRTLLALREIDPGFRAEGAAALSVSMDGTALSSARDRVRFFDGVLTRAAALPGVTAVGAINHLPLFGDVWTFGYLVEGQPVPDPGDEPRAIYRVASPGYFRAMAQPLLAGRDFDGRDTAAGMPVAIVNESLAKRWWPRQGPLGARLAFTTSSGPPTYLTIVGVAGNVRQRELTREASAEIYVPFTQRPGGDLSRSAVTLVARSTGSPATLLPSLREAVWAGDRHAAIYESVTLDEVLDREVWREQLAADLVGVFALIALTLAAVGIHGILSYTVSQRTREFGLRMALGAPQPAIRRLAAREAVVPVGIGLATGVVLAVVCGRLIEQLLVGVAPNEPRVFTATIAALTAVATLAAWRPVARASRIDPALALHAE
jgi:putative ABC transport system permease protein